MTSFLPSLVAGESVNIDSKMEPIRRDFTCVNLDRIIDTSESENILEVDARDGDFPGLAPRGEDELIVVDELFPSLQHDPFSRNVDRSDGLGTRTSFRCDVTEGFEYFTYRRGAQGYTKLDPQISSGLPFDLGGISYECFA